MTHLSSPPQNSAHWQHGHVTTNGVRLHYVTQGEGPLLLLLHGFPEFWYSWRYQIPALARSHKVVALDLRGYNDSDKPTAVADYRMDLLVADTVGVVKALGYSRCTLVGHDWGGAIAWHVAADHPQMIENLIILNLPHPARMVQGLRTPQQLLKSWYIFFFQLPWIPEWLLQWGDYRPIEMALLNSTVDKKAFSRADLDAYRTAAAKGGAITAMLNYYRGLFGGGFLARPWPLLTMPTLLIWGEEDLFLGKELTYGTEQYVQDLQVRYIPQCGHWVQQERPALVNQYIQEFLAE
ncbi:MAG: alpha/beta fold hydrolase [Cyanophyceae cyanobacterium]